MSSLCSTYTSSTASQTKIIVLLGIDFIKELIKHLHFFLTQQKLFLSLSHILCFYILLFTKLPFVLLAHLSKEMVHPSKLIHFLKRQWSWIYLVFFAIYRFSHFINGSDNLFRSCLFIINMMVSVWIRMDNSRTIIMHKIFFDIILFFAVHH